MYYDCTFFNRGESRIRHCKKKALIAYDPHKKKYVLFLSKEDHNHPEPINDLNKTRDYIESLIQNRIFSSKRIKELILKKKLLPLEDKQLYNFICYCKKKI